MTKLGKRQKAQVVELLRCAVHEGTIYGGCVTATPHREGKEGE